MSLAISIRNLGKMYKFYRSPAEKLLDLLGVNRVLFWRKPSTQTFWALRELNLDVQRGERLGIIGHNGAGKSTLLKIIGGIIAPTEGTAVVNGNVQALMELGTGFHPEFTGRQNIHAALGYQGLGVAAIRKAEREIVDFAELGDFIERPIKTYSAGMNARLAFATSTYLQPEILIIDEILGAGDAYFAGKCIERMRRITESSGATVLFVSHDISSVQRLCSRVVWVERGRIKMDGEPLGVIKAYSDHVRKDQDLRLKARDMKLARSQLTTANEGLYQPFLFHFVTDKPHPSKFHQIRGLRLLADGVEVGAIDVGGPMDNVPAQLHHVIDGPAMDWSQPIKAGGNWMRCYKDCSGFYQHAPFQFNVPRTEASTARRFTLEVDGWFDAGDPVVLERHVESGYERMATMASDCDGVQTFSFGNGEVQEGDPAPPLVAVEPTSTPDDYGNRKVMLRGVQLLDADGNERRVLTTGDRVLVRLSYEAFEPVRDAAFIFAVYLPDGQCASQVWATSAELGKPEISGRGSVQFVIDRLTLGRSPYVASAAIFTELRHDNVEPKAYHCLDRCIHFQVGQPLGEQYPERGLAPQQYYTEMVA